MAQYSVRLAVPKRGMHQGSVRAALRIVQELLWLLYSLGKGSGKSMLLRVFHTLGCLASSFLGTAGAPPSLESALWLQQWHSPGITHASCWASDRLDPISRLSQAAGLKRRALLSPSDPQQQPLIPIPAEGSAPQRQPDDAA